MSGLTTKELSKIYNKSPKTIWKVLNSHCYYSIGTHKEKIYSEAAIKFLDRYYGMAPEVQIEIVQVPVYIDVNWLLLPSKLNYLPDKLL